MFLRAAVIAPLMVMSSFLGAAPSRALTGSELLGSCEALLRDMRSEGQQIQVSRDGASCWFYMAAVQDLSVMADLQSKKRYLDICSPPESTLTQMVRVFAAYARNNPGRLHERASSVVLSALWAAFPCER